MKSLKLYQCEICGTQYKERLECEKCEKTHIQPKAIVGAKYIRMRDNAKGYPIAITVMMDDGHSVQYKR